MVRVEQNVCTHVVRGEQNLSVKMVKLSSVDQARAIGHLEAGLTQWDVAVLFGVSQSTISKLRLRYRDTHDVKDRLTRKELC